MDSVGTADDSSAFKTSRRLRIQLARIELSNVVTPAERPVSLALTAGRMSFRVKFLGLRCDLMKCPFCAFENDKVVDSRESKEGESIRRRRECLRCNKRFTTYERIDEIPYMVIKKDGRREKFERQKVLNGLLRACEKRPVSMSKLEQMVDDAENYVIDSADRERKTSEIGELIMNRLRRFDKVAYVRFASVYLDFKDVQEFMIELKDLLKTQGKELPGAPDKKKTI